MQPSVTERLALRAEETEAEELKVSFTGLPPGVGTGAGGKERNLRGKND